MSLIINAPEIDDFENSAKELIQQLSNSKNTAYIEHQVVNKKEKKIRLKNEKTPNLYKSFVFHCTETNTEMRS